MAQQALFAEKLVQFLWLYTQLQSVSTIYQVIPFAWLRWWITIEIAFVMNGKNKNEFYVEIWRIPREGTAGQILPACTYRYSNVKGSNEPLTEATEAHFELQNLNWLYFCVENEPVWLLYPFKNAGNLPDWFGQIHKHGKLTLCNPCK